MKKKYVAEDEFTGDFRKLILLDKITIYAPVASIYIRTPFYEGRIEALCLDDAVNDLK